MTEREGYWGSYLLYGPPGGGKTDFGVGAFWDPVGRRYRARGKLVTFGREDNPFLHVPEEARRTAAGVSLRLTVPNLDNRLWLEKLDKFTAALLTQAKRSWPLDVLLLDGLAELDLLWERTFTGNDRNGYEKWDGLMSMFFSYMQRLDPIELGCHIIMTTRVRERPRGTEAAENRREKALEDTANPFDYYPSLRGSFKDWIGHYFHNVFYLHTRRPALAAGVGEHVVQVLTRGDYLTKLQAERDWIAAGYPKEFTNATFYDVQHRLESLLGLPHILPTEVPSSTESPTSSSP